MVIKKKKNNSKGNIATNALSLFVASKEESRKINKTLSANKLARLEAKNFQESLQGMTKEEKIAANKARVAKYHPEPDFSTCSKAIYQSRKKIECEKNMKDRAKKLWYSIVSVPMGGMKKR